MTHAIISKEISALDAIIDGASNLAAEAFAKKADLKQGKLASEASGRVINAVKTRLDARLNVQKLIDLEAKLVNAKSVGADEGKGESNSVAGPKKQATGKIETAPAA